MSEGKTYGRWSVSSHPLYRRKGIKPNIGISFKVINTEGCEVRAKLAINFVASLAQESWFVTAVKLKSVRVLLTA